jgi:hypothetical protein
VRREHPPDNPEIHLEMTKIAEKRRRFGYHRSKPKIRRSPPETYDRQEQRRA